MTARKPKIAPAPAPEEVVKGIKGYDKDLKCRGFQFEVGKTYEHGGAVVMCESGFHAIEGYPLNVFGFYPPAGSRYTETQQSGQLIRQDDDGKIVSTRITIGVEIHLHEIIQRAVKWVFDRAKLEEGAHAVGPSGAASATGESGAASATGERGAVMGANGCALFLVYRTPHSGKIMHAWAGIAGRGGIKPLVWYRLNESGQPVEINAP